MNWLFPILIVLFIFMAPVLMSMRVDNIYPGVIECYLDNRTVVRTGLGAISVISVKGIVGKRGDKVNVDIKESKIVE